MELMSTLLGMILVVTVNSRSTTLMKPRFNLQEGINKNLLEDTKGLDNHNGINPDSMIYSTKELDHRQTYFEGAKIVRNFDPKQKYEQQDTDAKSLNSPMISIDTADLEHQVDNKHIENVAKKDNFGQSSHKKDKDSESLNADGNEKTKINNLNAGSNESTLNENNKAKFSMKTDMSRDDAYNSHDTGNGYTHEKKLKKNKDDRIKDEDEFKTENLESSENDIPESYDHKFQLDDAEHKEIENKKMKEKTDIEELKNNENTKAEEEIEQERTVTEKLRKEESTKGGEKEEKLKLDPKELSNYKNTKGDDEKEKAVNENLKTEKETNRKEKEEMTETEKLKNNNNTRGKQQEEMTVIENFKKLQKTSRKEEEKTETEIETQHEQEETEGDKEKKNSEESEKDEKTEEEVERTVKETLLEEETTEIEKEKEATEELKKGKETERDKFEITEKEKKKKVEKTNRVEGKENTNPEELYENEKTNGEKEKTETNGKEEANVYIEDLKKDEKTNLSHTSKHNVSALISLVKEQSLDTNSQISKETTEGEGRKTKVVLNKGVNDLNQNSKNYVIEHVEKIYGVTDFKNKEIIKTSKKTERVNENINNDMHDVNINETINSNKTPISEFDNILTLATNKNSLNQSFTDTNMRNPKIAKEAESTEIPENTKMNKITELRKLTSKEPDIHKQTSRLLGTLKASQNRLNIHEQKVTIQTATSREKLKGGRFNMHPGSSKNQETKKLQSIVEKKVTENEAKPTQGNIFTTDRQTQQTVDLPSTFPAAKTKTPSGNQLTFSSENKATFNKLENDAGNRNMHVNYKTTKTITMQGTLNKSDKVNEDNENNFAEKKFEDEYSSEDLCQDRNDPSRQYTGSALVAAAVGGVFIGAFAVLLLFHVRQKCKRYINGDYRRVPVEYDFELNPRFKAH